MATPADVSQTAESLKAAALAAEATPVVTQAELTGQSVTETRDFGTITKHPDGKLRVEYTTGEIFEGTAEELVEKVSKSNVETKKYAQQLKAEKEAAAPKPQPIEPTEDERLAEAVLEYAAKATGTTPAEIREGFKEIEIQRNLRVSQQFLAEHPEFPNDKLAADKLTETLTELGLPMTTRNLSVAHADCMARKIYAPLTVEQQQASLTGGGGARAGQPPPNPPAGTRSETVNLDPWKMSMTELKKAAEDQSRRQ